MELRVVLGGELSRRRCRWALLGAAGVYCGVVARRGAKGEGGWIWPTLLVGARYVLAPGGAGMSSAVARVCRWCTFLGRKRQMAMTGTCARTHMATNFVPAASLRARGLRPPRPPKRVHKTGPPCGALLHSKKNKLHDGTLVVSHPLLLGFDPVEPIQRQPRVPRHRAIPTARAPLLALVLPVARDGGFAGLWSGGVVGWWGGGVVGW